LVIEISVGQCCGVCGAATLGSVASGVVRGIQGEVRCEIESWVLLAFLYGSSVHQSCSLLESPDLFGDDLFR
jgi:hypothetical protein